MFNLSCNEYMLLLSEKKEVRIQIPSNYFQYPDLKDVK